jgi:uncharacterized membrane protein YeaQ/YmgE (transglycosylase-associated protein family)
MTVEQLLLIGIVGLVAGFLATHLVSGHGYGVLGDLLVGVLGAIIGSVILGPFIGTYILKPFHVRATSIMGMMIIAFVGAVVLLVVARVVDRAGLTQSSSSAGSSAAPVRRRLL